MAGYMDKIYTYIPERVQVFIDAYVVSGLVSVAITKDQPTFKTIKGIRGQNTRVRQQDSSYSITLELQQVDPVNDFLTDIHIEDTDSGGVGFFPMKILDLNGTTRFYTETAYIEQIPEIAFSTDFNNRQWVIKTLDTNGVFLGGNDIITLSQNFAELNTTNRR